MLIIKKALVYGKGSSCASRCYKSSVLMLNFKENQRHKTAFVMRIIKAVGKIIVGEIFSNVDKTF